SHSVKVYLVPTSGGDPSMYAQPMIPHSAERADDIGWFIAAQIPPWRANDIMEIASTVYTESTLVEISIMICGAAEFLRAYTLSSIEALEMDIPGDNEDNESM